MLNCAWRSGCATRHPALRGHVSKDQLELCVGLWVQFCWDTSCSWCFVSPVSDCTASDVCWPGDGLLFSNCGRCCLMNPLEGCCTSWCGLKIGLFILTVEAPPANHTWKYSRATTKQYAEAAPARTPLTWILRGTYVCDWLWAHLHHRACRHLCCAVHSLGIDLAILLTQSSNIFYLVEYWISLSWHALYTSNK